MFAAYSPAAIAFARICGGQLAADVVEPLDLVLVRVRARVSTNARTVSTISRCSSVEPEVHGSALASAAKANRLPDPRRDRRAPRAPRAAARGGPAARVAAA